MTSRHLCMCGMDCFCLQRVQNNVSFKLLPNAKAPCPESGCEDKSLIPANNPPFPPHQQGHQVPSKNTTQKTSRLVL